MLRDSLKDFQTFLLPKSRKNAPFMSAQHTFDSLGLALPPLPGPAGLYQPCLINGRHVYLSGHLPFQEDGSLIKGKVGESMSVDDATAAARQVGLTILSTLIGTLGSLDRVSRVLKLFGMVNATADFVDHPKVINGCSELFKSVWGPEHGVGVRSAVGVASLPIGVPVEIEATFELA
ncbi:MAG: hypothetical protein RLZZ622_1306 [Planctomycetota bacterium]